MKTLNGWHIIHTFDGKLNWQELNAAIAFDSGVEEPYCDTEADYNQAVREGWIRFQDGKTTVWADGEYCEEDHKTWYALMTGPEDTDWGTGTFDRDEAFQRVREMRDIYPDAYIAVIDDGPDPICIEEIHDI